jgi:hypothetical protein
MIFRKKSNFSCANVILCGFDVDFKILTALKGWVGHAPQGRGALHIMIFILTLILIFRQKAKKLFRGIDFSGEICYFYNI